MIVMPREKPVLEKLNSYYLDLPRLLEHCQGEFGSGGIYFGSPAAEGVIFFDKDELLNGFFLSKAGESQGRPAIDALLGADEYNFAIDVYQLDSGLIDFWAHMPAAQVLYEGLNTEFTDFGVIFKKMRSEGLTGFFNIALNNGEEGVLLFLSNGEVIGGSCSWDKDADFAVKDNLARLFGKIKNRGCVFHINKIFSSDDTRTTEDREANQGSAFDVLVPLGELLGVFEKRVREESAGQEDFSLLLKRKFVEKANRYAFLDPFAAEFDYANQTIAYSGTASDEELVRGVVESVKELAGELGISLQDLVSSGEWSRNSMETIREFGVDF